MASLPGAMVSLMPCYSPWSECDPGLSFEAWVKEKIFKVDSAYILEKMKSVLAEPEAMEQDDEMVVAFTGRGGGGNPRLKPLTAINESAKTTGKPGSQLARFAIRRCWLATPRETKDNCEIFTLHARDILNDATLSGPAPRTWPAVIVVLLQEPLNYRESSRDNPLRAEVSAVREVFGCEADRNVVERICRETVDEMVAEQNLLEDELQGRIFSKHSVRWQCRVTCETLQRLVEAIFNDAQLEASASPSTMFAIGDEPILPTSSDDIVKAYCSCVDGAKFPVWLSTNCRGLDYRPVAPNTYFADEAAIIHCLVHAAKGRLLYSLQLHSNITEADVVIGKADDLDASVFRIAATLADWNSWGESDNNQLDEGEWDSTDKHRVMFVIKKSKLEELGRESRHELWRHGRLHFVQSAPRAAYARWRMKVAPDLDVKRRIKTFDDDGQPVTRF